MVSRNKIVTTVIILLLLSVLFSGCTEEKNITPAPDSTQKEVVNVSSQNLTQSSKEENIPEIKITSFSSIYLHDNNEDIYLFSWENVPGNESNGLLNYLKNDLHISWVENAQITRDDMNKTIRVFTNENSIEIMLDNESVLLKRDRGYERYDLWVREKNDTHDVYNKKRGNKYDISERYYAMYNLSIKNNGSNTIDFKLNGLRLHEGDRIFNTTTLEPYRSFLLDVLQDIEKENKLQDTTLLPGQSSNGIVAFRVNSLYNKSFLLKYDTKTVSSASFKKSIEALEAAEYFDYSVALGIPPYNLCREINEMYLFSWDEIPGNDSERLIEYLIQKFGIDWKIARFEKIDDGKTIIATNGKNRISIGFNDEKTRVNLKNDDGSTFELNARTDNSKLIIYSGTRGSYEPIFDDCEAWANWVNRSIFETFQKSDVERIRKSLPDFIPTREMVYALRVIPERNIIMSPVIKRLDMPHLLVTDDTGEEIINTSEIEGLAVLSNQTYTFKPRLGQNFPLGLNFSGMNISNASVVQISFKASYITKYRLSGIIGETGRLSYSNQDVILDDKLNIIVVRYSPDAFHLG